MKKRKPYNSRGHRKFSSSKVNHFNFLLSPTIDSRRATIGIVSNPNHGARLALLFYYSGQSRLLGRRPIVRDVAMNPVDHPG